MTTIPRPAPILELRGITKRFGDVVASSNVTLSIGKGEIVGLLGENGAGKTTLMNIVFGLYRPDEGSIAMEGSMVEVGSTSDAMTLGIGMVQQHAHIVSRHTVLENILAGLPGRNGVLDRRSALARLAELSKLYGLSLDPHRLASTLTIGEKQRLDIIRALFRPTRLLILDEPTSVLTPQEIDGLFLAIKALARDGIGIILISHKLHHVRQLTHRVVVMRRGALVADVVNDGQLSDTDLAVMMCGRQPNRVVREASRPGPATLELQSLVLDGGRKLHPEINLTVRSGEIVGIAGVAGNGQVALAETIAGLRRLRAGTISVGHDNVTGTVASATRAGIAYIPEDRIGAGLSPGLSVAANMVLSRFRHAPFSRFGWLNRTAISAFAKKLISQYEIRPSDPNLKISLLSGGNQQKAIVAREFEHNPRVLVVAQPTRGLDLAAASFVHGQIMALKARGCAVLLISEDLDELFQLSDRIAVMFEGGVVFDGAAEGLTVARVGVAMNGGKVQTMEAA